MITVGADSYWLRDSQPLLTQKRQATCGELRILVCVFVSVCMYVIGFKVLVAKLGVRFL